MDTSSKRRDSGSSAKCARLTSTLFLVLADTPALAQTDFEREQVSHGNFIEKKELWIFCQTCKAYFYIFLYGL
jgi:hypothetical protein